MSQLSRRRLEVFAKQEEIREQMGRLWNFSSTL